MSFTKTITAAAALTLSAGAALAWDDAYKGDATHNPNSNVLIHSYSAAANNCPAGLQPVTIGGVICCGTPTAGPYINRAGGTNHRQKAARHVSNAPRAYAPAGEKGVVYR